MSVPPAGLEVTVYPVTAEPPLLAGAEKLTVAEVLPATAEAAVGALGTVEGITALLAADAVLPAPVVAVTTKV